MARIPYDVSRVPDEPPSREMRRRTVKSGGASTNGRKPRRLKGKPGSFTARFAERRVDLVRLVEEGLPPMEYLPASDKMLVRAKRHHIAAPAKTGKSIGMLVHWVDMVLEGARVAILDRENGSDVYARRLADIFDARHLTPKQRGAVRTRLSYYEFPELRPKDAEELVHCLRRADLVVFDSQRMFLSDFGLKEDESDDYAAFMSYAIDPLFRAGISTAILDNTGHGDKTRGRGTAAKGDLNEILFSMEAEDKFDVHQQGRLLLKIERSRFGNYGEWAMEIGGGRFEPWRSLAGDERADFRDAVIAALADGKPLGQDKLIAAARAAGVQIGTDTARRFLKTYVQDESMPIKQMAKGYVRDES